MDTFGDINTGSITSTGDVSANNIVVSGLVDGRDIATDGSKLDGIEAGATGDQTANEILTLVKTVDGTGSGLDADLLDGQHASDILAQAASDAADQIGNGRVEITNGTGISGSGSFNLNDASNTTITISHADTSSVSDVSLTNGNVVSGLTFDTFGHVQSTTSTDLDNRYYTQTLLNSGQLDSRYYTETEADSKFVDVTGDTMSGDLTVNADIIQEESKFISETITTTSAVSNTLYAFAHATYGSAEITIQATQASNRHITKLLITHDGTTPIATEYGTVYTGSELAAFNIQITGPVLQITATPASASSTTFKIVGTLINA